MLPRWLRSRRQIAGSILYCSGVLLGFLTVEKVYGAIAAAVSSVRAGARARPNIVRAAMRRRSPAHPTAASVATTINNEPMPELARGRTTWSWNAICSVPPKLDAPACHRVRRRFPLGRADTPSRSRRLRCRRRSTAPSSDCARMCMAMAASTSARPMWAHPQDRFEVAVVGFATDRVDRNVPARCPGRTPHAKDLVGDMRDVEGGSERELGFDLTELLHLGGPGPSMRC